MLNFLSKRLYKNKAFFFWLILLFIMIFVAAWAWIFFDWRYQEKMKAYVMQLNKEAYALKFDQEELLKIEKARLKNKQLIDEGNIIFLKTILYLFDQSSQYSIQSLVVNTQGGQLQVICAKKNELAGCLKRLEEQHLFYISVKKIENNDGQEEAKVTLDFQMDKKS